MATTKEAVYSSNGAGPGGRAVRLGAGCGGGEKMMGVAKVSWLLLISGSGSLASTRAMLVIRPVAEGRTTKVTLTLAPLGRMPRLLIRLPLLEKKLP
jgi:hypothetical protein